AASLLRTGPFRTIVVCSGDRFDYLLRPPRAQPAEAVYSAGGAAAVLTASAENELLAYSHLTHEDLSIHAQMAPVAGGSRWPVDPRALAEDAHQWRNTMTVSQAAALRAYLKRADRHNVSTVCREAGWDTFDFIAVSPLDVRAQLESLAELGIGEDKTLLTLPALGHMGPADSLVSVGLAIAAGRSVGPRLLMSTRSITSSNALAIQGRASDLGISVRGKGA